MPGSKVRWVAIAKGELSAWPPHHEYEHGN
jgi:hypothetical protein